VSFLTQIIVVRALTKSGYGEIAFALSVVLILQSLLPLGIDRSDTRFLAKYDEEGRRDRVLGVIVLEAAVIVCLSAAILLPAFALWPAHTKQTWDEEVVGTLLLLGPLFALDNLVVNVFAVFATPWAVFFRRYVLDPGLKFAVAVAMVASGGGPVFLAVGYVITSLASVALYGAMLVALLKKKGFLKHGRGPVLDVPFREIMTFSVPLLIANVVAVAGTEFAAVVLAHFRGAAEVASFRAIEPFAALNLVVMYAFTTLYTPAAARLAARRETASLNDLYWRSAAWVAVLTFPAVVMTTVFARPLTVTTLGERYAGSSSYLLILSAAYFVNVASGFNGVTALIAGRVRFMTVGSLLVLAWMAVADLVLASKWGAGGAAVAVASTIVVHNVVKHLGFGLATGMKWWDLQQFEVLVKLCIIMVVLIVVSRLFHPSLVAAVAISIVAGGVALRWLSATLRLTETFPEIAALPAVRWLAG
jgi:O-antigen/teichoic acid export membrane protein